MAKRQKSMAFEPKPYEIKVYATNRPGAHQIGPVGNQAAAKEQASIQTWTELKVRHPGLEGLDREHERLAR
jgi:hypothetical protein